MSASATFRDHFSGHADAYAAYRPHYPDALFEWIARRAPGRGRAWDCGSGSGQAAVGLARHFALVVATDGSRQQLARGPRAPRIARSVALAERCGLAAGSVDLVAVAQAAHWFDPGPFHAEIRRVARPGGLVALWCYGPSRVAPEVDRVVDAFYSDIVGPYWPPERHWVEDLYRALPFPFAEIEAPSFEMRTESDLGGLLGYLGTWSAARRYLAERGVDPRDRITPELTGAWPRSDGGTVELTWPIGLRVGRVEGGPA